MRGGTFEMITADEATVNETLDMSLIDFEESRSRCVKERNAGKVSFSFKIENNKKVSSVSVSMRISPIDKYGYWRVNQANLTIIRADIERKRTFQLKIPSMYSAADYSYSCSELELNTVYRKKGQDNETKFEPSARITLERFQLQPFGELERKIFAPSYDCSAWMTIPEVMGLILVLFIIVVTSIGAILLKRIETNDFKFTREGILFTQAQVESSKRQG